MVGSVMALVAPVAPRVVGPDLWRGTEPSPRESSTSEYEGQRGIYIPIIAQQAYVSVEDFQHEEGVADLDCSRLPFQPAGRIPVARPSSNRRYGK